MGHTHIYEHRADCPALTDAEEICLCERARYRKVFIIGISFALLEYTIGIIAQSAALHADALHLAADATTDLFAFTIANLVIAFPHREGLLRGRGGYIQAFLLSIVAVFVVLEGIERLEDPPVVDAWLVIVTGFVFTLVNGYRFTVLHEGNPFVFLKNVFVSYRSGAREKTTFIGEAFHVLSDVGMSFIVLIGGVALLVSGNHTVDIVCSFVMAGLMITSAIMVIVFAQRESGDENHSH